MGKFDHIRKKEPEEITFPVKSRTSRRLYAYLGSLGITNGTIFDLVSGGLVYQADDPQNAVFINPEKTYAEIHGMNSKPYRDILQKDEKQFWYFTVGEDVPEHALVCDSPIDALCLMEYRRDPENPENAIYCAIGNVTRQPKIDRIKKQFKTIIAIPGDNAIIADNADCGVLLPSRGNWEDELKDGPDEFT